MFICAYIHLITYTRLWRPFTYIGHSLGDLFHVFFLRSPRGLPLHWVIGWEMPVRCVVLVHMVIEFRAHCWTTGQFCSLLSDTWEAHSRSCLYHHSQFTFNTSSQKNSFKNYVNYLFFTQKFSKSPHFIKNKSYIHTTATAPSEPYFLPPIFSDTSPTLYTAFPPLPLYPGGYRDMCSFSIPGKIQPQASHFTEKIDAITKKLHWLFSLFG